MTKPTITHWATWFVPYFRTGRLVAGFPPNHCGMVLQVKINRVSHGIGVK